MPPFIALLAGLLLITWLIRTDMSHRSTGSSALWIPGLWVLVSGSRPVAYWLAMMGISGGATGTESDPANTIFYALLIVAAAVVLARRHFSWARLFQDNKALMLIYSYLALSSVWAPETFITFRRIFKDFGSVLVALVILTEPNPWFVCRVVFVRAAFFLFPLSLVVSKYYPAIGRYTARAGDSFYTGLTTHKNTLGQVVFLIMLFLVWDLIEIPKELDFANLRTARWVRYIALAIGLILIFMAQSATSQICLTLGTTLLLVFRKLAKSPKGPRIFWIGAAVLSLTVLADNTLDISGSILELFGRNKTLTGRSIIWTTVLNHQPHTVVGYGYYAFWDTPMAAVIYEEAGDFIHIKTVHNGYLEVFIDGGFVGVALLILFIIATGRIAYARLFKSAPSIALPLIVWIIALIYNNSESSFFRLDLLWFTFLLLTIRFPSQERILGILDHPGDPRGEYNWELPEPYQN